MKKLTVICSECDTILVTLEKRHINIDDFLVNTYDEEGNILESKSCFTCECGNNVIVTEDDIS